MDELEKKLRCCFAEHGFDIPLIFFEVAGSTNDEAKKYAATHSEEAVFIAKRQTSGRGRLGRSFDSEAGGLYFSYLHYPKASADDAVMLTVYAAVCLCLAIEELIPSAKPTIKWVNDIRIGNGKLAGILAEGAFSPSSDRFAYAVTGIGVNLFSREYPEQIRGIATDIESEYGVRLPIEKLAVGLYKRLSGFNEARKDEYLEEYRRRSCVIGKRVTVISADSTYEALATGINDKGELCVRLDSGEERCLFTGEVGIKV